MQNTYQDYKTARNAAWDVLIRYKINSLPVRISNLCNQMGIKLVSYESGETFLKSKKLWEHTYLNDGFCSIISNQYFIFYNGNVQPNGRVRFTVAHELGHIILGHLETENISCRNQTSMWNRGEENPKNKYETMANIFAVRLLSPAIVLHELQILSENDIADRCGLSHLAARYRSDRMRKLEERNKFYTDKREIIVAKNFNVYLNQPQSVVKLKKDKP